MKINIETIPHNDHRYTTVGDYWVDENGTMQIRVSEMGNAKYELLIAIHELIEQNICLDRNIKEEDITAFDIQFERERMEEKHGPTDEPGDDRDAPYREAHFTATNFERMLADVLRVDWKSYEEKVNSL